MDVGTSTSSSSSRRRGAGARSSVVAGSVWESRMKHDEVRGGIKRKTWKSESFEGFERNPIQIARGKVEEQSVSGDGNGVKRSPIQGRKLRSEGTKEMERSPIGVRKTRSESLKEVGESGQGIERNSVLRKAKSDSVSVSVPVPAPTPVGSGKDGVVIVDDDHDNDYDESGNGIEPNEEVLDESIDGSIEEIEKNPVESEKSGSDEACKEFGVCQEKFISSNVEVLKSAPKCDDDVDDKDENGENEEVDEEIEVGVEVEVEKKSLDVKEIKKTEPKPNKVINGEKVVNEVKKVHFERREVKKLHQVYQKQPEPISLNVKKRPPVIRSATVHSSYAKGSSKSSSSAASDQYHSFPETHSRLQSFVDLIMWKDISRSVFIFGIGTFIILSSSYTKDLNISFISVMSYLGLVYLAAIFLFRSIVCRGVIDIEYTNYVLGEEEAIWLLKLVLPYLNEFLLKLKALFSGDPATTMKLAVLLFVLARCGSSITIWTMAKLGFFGVFTVPKVCSLYSAQITAYAKFWGRRFRDAWNSCSHKKAVTVAAFLLVWNLSSIVARIWAVFMLFVAFRYYQQTIVIDDWVEEGAEGEETWYEPIGEQRQGHGPTIVDNNKQKKRS
ncbi:Reticulon [Trema orientale]|uniref:Reticulon-like protein n=1 Tax=Trema orientale TaxID=63057 RepID=A0A2P5F3B0_TREOI|nr:Reticulon [Trema orientale]